VVQTITSAHNEIQSYSADPKVVHLIIGCIIACWQSQDDH